MSQTKRALIVGASRGIGLALAAELATRDWQVIATARQPDSELATKALQGVTVELVDIDHGEQVDALGRRLAGQRFDLLIVNAGVKGPAHQSVTDASADEVSALFGTNALAPIQLARKFLPLMGDAATLGFMSSAMGSVAANTSGGLELYRGSKAALNSLTRGLAAEVVSKGISVLTLHPGWVRTDMGGPGAPLSVGDSASGLVDVVTTPRPAGHYFLDYRGKTIAW